MITIRILIFLTFMFGCELVCAGNHASVVGNVSCSEFTAEDCKLYFSLKNKFESGQLDADGYFRFAELLRDSDKFELRISVLRAGLQIVKNFNPTKINSSITQTFYSEIPFYHALGDAYLDNQDVDGALGVLWEGVVRSSGSGELLQYHLNILKSEGKQDAAEVILQERCGKYFVSGDLCLEK